ncbi:hypothetical protein [Nonomuraea endophytica]|uniref:Uncharacterized protein n=1 Tax=Nonomuraea endophytica TaxID=714136 RepID=A0A7W8A372_9ACTN|nr:hypothetical protein [Nonomuraea endophytica]MBB5078751.1 hypothetical protein [Nonomuraea endophytica]
MSHPKRAQAARDLSRRLDGADVVTDPSQAGTPSPLRTSVHAWRAADPGATHHLVVQDDVVPCENFLRRVRQGIRLFPDAVLAFYANWSSMNGAAVRLAAAAGATWVQEVGGEYFPTLAVVMPAAYVADYVAFAEPYTAWWGDDDEVMTEFVLARGLDAYVSVPNLVEHGEQDSVAGNGSHGIRQAACYLPDPGHTHEALAHSIELIPWLTKGRAIALARTSGNGYPAYVRRPWADMATPFKVDTMELHRAYQRLVSAGPGLARARDGLGELYLSSLWNVSVLLGAAVHAEKVPVRTLIGERPSSVDQSVRRAAVATLPIGGVAWTFLPEEHLALYAREVADVAEAGFVRGLDGS